MLQKMDKIWVQKLAYVTDKYAGDKNTKYPLDVLKDYIDDKWTTCYGKERSVSFRLSLEG